jgi:hypothetical protein
MLFVLSAPAFATSTLDEWQAVRECAKAVDLAESSDALDFDEHRYFPDIHSVYRGTVTFSKNGAVITEPAKDWFLYFKKDGYGAIVDRAVIEDSVLRAKTLGYGAFWILLKNRTEPDPPYWKQLLGLSAPSKHSCFKVKLNISDELKEGFFVSKFLAIRNGTADECSASSLYGMVAEKTRRFFYDNEELLNFIYDAGYSLIELPVQRANSAAFALKISKHADHAAIEYTKRSLNRIWSALDSSACQSPTLRQDFARHVSRLKAEVTVSLDLLPGA